MKIGVTGGAGFIGSHLTDKLLDLGYEVYCIDNFNDFYDPSEKRENISSHLMNSNYQLFEGDMRDKSFIERISPDFNVDAIVHLAAKAGVRPSVINPYEYEANNVLGTLNALELARQCKAKKFVLGSSSSVYGLNKKTPFSEDDALLTPASPYAASKIASEAISHTYSHLYNIPTVALRFFTVYGPRQRPDLAFRKFLTAVMNDQPISIYGDGTSGRDYTFVGDIVQGVVSAIHYDGKLHDIFNLGNSSPVLLKDLISIIEDVTGKEAKKIYQSPQDGDVPITFADISKSERLLNYKPKTQLHEGLSLMLEWLMAVGIK